MLNAICDKLDIAPCTRLRNMVALVRNEFKADLTRFSVRRALIGWSKKATQNIAQERNQDLRDDYIYEVSFLRSDQLVFLDETGVDRSIGIHSKGWARRGKRPRQVKRFHRGHRFQILPAYTQDGVIHFRVIMSCDLTSIPACQTTGVPEKKDQLGNFTLT
jgi:hypothetical protein